MSWDILSAIARGIPWTIALTVSAFTTGAALGMAVCALNVSPVGAFRLVARTYILVLRSVPPIVWLFFIFFGLGSDVAGLTPFQAACIGLGLITSANMAEIYRGALSAIHPGQAEAAFALSLSGRHRLFDVIGPQLLRVALPSGATYAMGLLKDTATASTIGVQEIAFQAYNTSQRTFHSLDIYAMSGLLYIGIGLPVAWMTRWADSKLQARVAR